MIDARLFRKSNPSYPKLFTKKSDEIDLSLWGSSSTAQPDSERVKSNGADLDKMKDDDLFICSATALGFSLNDKFWGKAYICTDTVILRADALMQESMQWKILKTLNGLRYLLTL